MRLFYAIMLPNDVSEIVSAEQKAVRDQIGPHGIRWESPEKLHITLRFLGDVPPEKLEAVKSAGRVAALRSGPFELRLRGLGTFPQRRPARVIWLGAESSVSGYTQMVRNLEGELIACGFDGSRESASGEPSAHI